MPGKSFKIGSPESKNWLRLDNAAKIFPVITNNIRTSVFRLSIELKDRVRHAELQLAFERTLDKYPYFRSQMKKGFFWYWLEPSEAIPRIQLDEGEPCRAFNMNHRNHLMMRILARENMISAEFFHVLCDGGGGLMFLMAVIKRYGELCGWDVEESYHPIHPDSEVSDELTEDAYKKYFRKKIPSPARLSKAYHLPFKLDRKPVYKVTALEIQTSEIIAESKRHNVTLTEYLASVYLHCLQKFFITSGRKGKRFRRSILRVMIPVNLRKIFPSNTFRNFALFIVPEIDPGLGEYTFREILNTVHHYMQLETDKRQIMRILRRNVGGEKNLMVRTIPLFMKVPVLWIAFSLFGPNLYSGLITNVGRSNIPEKFSTYVDRLRFYPPPPDKKIKVSSAMISHGEKLVLSFANLSTTMKFEREVIRFLQNEGISLKVLNN